MISVGATAATTLTVGKVSGKAGTTVSLPVTLQAPAGSVSSLQFDLTLPANVSTVSVTAGPLMTAAAKSHGAALKGSVWTIIVYGADNKNSMATGRLLTALVRIAAGTAAGTLRVPVSNAVFASADGQKVQGGPSGGGSIQVLP